MDNFKALLGATRPAFLLLTPVCIAVGVGTVYWQTSTLNWWHVLLIFIGALSAHISVNLFNEYFDFKSGLDTKTTRTPFSGGSGSLPTNPAATSLVFWFAWITFLLTLLVGVYFIALQGVGLFPLGLLGLFLLVTYTTWWAYNPVLCLLAPGIGFGTLMIMGTCYALTGSYSVHAFVASLAPTFLVSNLLLLNQFPDVEADQSIGRKHFPITIGRKACSQLFGMLLVFAYLVIVVGVLLTLLPHYTLLALLTAPLAWKCYQGVRRHSHDIPALLPSMQQNVVINLLTPVLISVGLFIG